MLSGFIYELPSSGTAEVRNLWAQSNIGIMGMWVFEMGQNLNEPFVLPGGKLSSGLLDMSQICSGDISPKMANMMKTQQSLKIHKCVMPAFTTLELQFSGSIFQIRKPATFHVNSMQIRGEENSYFSLMLLVILCCEISMLLLR